MSQEELAYKADLHRTYIGMIERAEKNITLLNIAKIANALGVENIWLGIADSSNSFKCCFLNFRKSMAPTSLRKTRPNLFLCHKKTAF